MPHHQSLGSNWTRRAVLQAGAGLAAYAVTRQAYAETAVQATNICVDWPILDPAVDKTPLQQAKKSPVAAALFHDNNSLRFEDHLPAAAASAVLRAPTDEKSTSPTGPSRAAFLNSWPNPLLKVFFMTATSSKLRRVVMEQIQLWSACCGIRFQEAASILDSQIRVDFRRGLGHFSAVGVDANGTPREQTMNLDMNDLSVDDPYNRGVILHEFGHAMGMIHEHQSPASSIDFRPATDRQMQDFFFPRGIDSVAKINANIVNRYAAARLTKFSDFDRESIMLYAFPGSVTVSGVGTPQNTILSAVDKKYALLLYPDQNVKPDSNGKGDSKVTPQNFTITLGGDAVEAKLVAGAKLEFNLTIPGDQGGKTIVIYTEGTTRLMLFLTDAAGKDLTPKDTPEHGTPDYMNEVIRTKLPAGDYKVLVTHPSARGGGPFRIQARTGTSDRPIASPNRFQ